MQTRSPLCIFLTLNWAYVLRLQTQFCRNINKIVRKCREDNFHKMKAKGVVGLKETRLVSLKSDLQLTHWW